MQTFGNGKRRFLKIFRGILYDKTKKLPRFLLAVPLKGEEARRNTQATRLCPQVGMTLACMRRKGQSCRRRQNTQTSITFSILIV